MKNKNLDIVPFNENNLKGASYDITPTIIALSTRCGMLESVYCDTKYPFNGNVKICAVEKSPKSEIYAISNLFF